MSAAFAPDATRTAPPSGDREAAARTVRAGTSTFGARLATVGAGARLLAAAALLAGAGRLLSTARRGVEPAFLIAAGSSRLDGPDRRRGRSLAGGGCAPGRSGPAAVHHRAPWGRAGVPDRGGFVAAGDGPDRRRGRGSGADGRARARGREADDRARRLPVRRRGCERGALLRRRLPCRRLAAAGAREQRPAGRRAASFRLVARHLLRRHALFGVFHQERVAHPVRVGDGQGVDGHAKLILRRVQLVGRDDAVELGAAQRDRALRGHARGGQQKTDAGEEGSPLDTHDVVSLHMTSFNPRRFYGGEENKPNVPLNRVETTVVAHASLVHDDRDGRAGWAAEGSRRLPAMWVIRQSRSENRSRSRGRPP